jgi:hypothetical protein
MPPVLSEAAVCPRSLLLPCRVYRAGSLALFWLMDLFELICNSGLLYVLVVLRFTFVALEVALIIAQVASLLCCSSPVLVLSM